METGLSKTVIKAAMNKGAVWLGSGNNKKRIRRAKKNLVPGDLVSIYYSKKVQEKVPVKPTLIDDRIIFSVWEKPVGLMSGGSRFGDHCSINREVEKHLGRTTLLVHRLDLYVWGLMVLAHSKTAASHISKQFQNRETKKIYHAIVQGRLTDKKIVDSPVDSKPAFSIVKPIEFDKDKSLVEVRILTGRKHQVRRHLASINHPIVGDRQYGSEKSGGIQLAAVELGFKSPADNALLTYELAAHKKPRFLVHETK